MRNVPLRQIAHYLGLISDIDAQVTGYQIDSRLIQAGELFFALKGEKTDGHLHLADAKANGAISAIVSKTYEGPSYGLFLLAVDDPTMSLQELARHFMSASSAQIIGITGSVGKTTTKDFIATLLGGKFKVGKTYASYNTKLTFPITLLNMQGDEEVLVLEMGMSEPGDLARLIQIAAPDIAVLTKVALSHSAFFPGGLDEIARGKAEIFSHPRTKTAIFYEGFHEFAELASQIQAEKVTFSLEKRSVDYFLTLSEGHYLVDERGVRAYQFDPPFKQPHVLHNFLAAVSVCRLLKMQWDEINQQVGKLQLPKMRFEQFEREGVLFINDAYNANPESMRSALASLPEPKEGGKRIAVLGEMRELGVFSENCHLEVGRFAQKFVDHLLCLGEETLPLYEGFQEVKKPAEHFLDRVSLKERLKALMSPGDVVLVKGSRSVQLDQIFELL
ncbi:MAG: UDP-N-acetylmuramoyl-tripeptide--D-alanyl-D-alanine ligase [Chlamydiota bacterium]